MSKPNMRNFNKFARITLQRYERYLPTAFDESLTLLEKMNKLIEYLNAMGVQLNDVVEQWNEVMEWIINDGINDTVLERLDEMVNDGTLATIINEHIFNELNDKVDGVVDRMDTVEDDLSGFKDEILDEMLGFKDETQTHLKQLHYNIKDYGAVGDGVHDDSDALQNALDAIEANGGGKLFIPEGDYFTRGAFDMPGNTTIEGVGALSRFTRSNQSMMFRINGSLGDSTRVIQDSNLGDHFIHVQDTSLFEIGDYIRIVSQRVASSLEDTDEDYYLGHTTSTQHALYYGEIRQISDIRASTNQLFFRGGLIFPGYNSHDNDETDPMARDYATVERVDFKKNVVFKNIAFDGAFSNIMRFDICVDAVVDNVTWTNARLGDFVSFHNSLNCQARNSKVYYLPEVSVPNHYSRNAFKTVSSTNCGFDNVEVSHGTQPVDFTYTTSDAILSVPNINSYLTNSRMFAPLFDGMTSHPGTIHVKVSDNAFLNCRQDGVFIRTRNAIVTNNVITGGITSADEGSFVGVKINQDVSQNCVVSGNNIDGFTIGVRTHDNVNTEIKKLNLLISNNVITRMNRGVQLRRGGASTFTGRSLVRIVNNTFTNFIQGYGKGVDIFPRYQHITIHGNTFEFNENANGGIYSRGNAGRFIITGNVFTNVSSTFKVLWFGSITESGISNEYLFKDNVSDGTRFRESNFDTANLGGTFTDQHYHNVQPYTDNQLNMGSASIRWRTGVFANGIQQTSDRNYKENITPLQYGLDFINALTPVEYTMKDDNDDVHFGLIAQDVEPLLDKLNADVKYSLINKDEGIYSMNYSEIIPILITAIQELSNKR